MKRFWFDCLMVTIFTFAFMYGLSKLLDLKVFSAFDPIGQAIGDMEVSDIAFRLRDEPPYDSNVVIVNIGESESKAQSRALIAEEVLNIIKYKPKVIGFDILFGPPDDALDSIASISLGESIKKAQEAGIKVVMAEKLMQTDRLITEKGDTEEQDSIEHSFDVIRRNSFEGYVNLDTDAEHQEDLKACRIINPRILVKDKYELALEVRMVMCADSLKAQKFIDRNNYSEVINYRGNVVDIHGASLEGYRGKYGLLSVEEALDTGYYQETAGLIENKIVLFGYLGQDIFATSWDDKFFTPINVNYAGKTRPDMFGVVVHANVISMILKEDYVDTMPLWGQITLAIIVLMLTVALFFKIEAKMPIWYDLLSLIIQVALVILFSFIMIMAFSKYSIKLDFTLTLAAAALVGTCFELYNGGVLRLYHVITSRFTKPKDEV
jgi:CHASE2 domain-containing sensor protein